YYYLHILITYNILYIIIHNY
ncbi:hypothetical protein EAG_11425, partial [Camponotus floridanus]